MKDLPIYKINNKFYYKDNRLQEYRNINNIQDSIKFLEYPTLQKPTREDSIKLYGGGKI